MFVCLSFPYSRISSSCFSLPLVEDSDFFLESLDPSLFPGVSSDVKVHNGFKDAQAASASAVLNAVQSTLQSSGSSSVTVVGHSLGAAIALIDTMFLSVNLDPSVSVQHIGYGLPRVSCGSLFSPFDESAELTTGVRRATRHSPTSSTRRSTQCTSTTRRISSRSFPAASSASIRHLARSTLRRTGRG
jgi:hypothetical protein